MNKTLIGLLLSFFVVSSLFGVAFAAKQPKTVTGTFEKVSPGNYRFTLTNSGGKAIYHFQLDLTYSAVQTVNVTVTLPANWIGGAGPNPASGAFIVGWTASANKYFLKSPNSIIVTFTVAPPLTGTLSGDWHAIDYLGHASYTGTISA